MHARLVIFQCFFSVWLPGNGYLDVHQSLYQPNFQPAGIQLQGIAFSRLRFTILHVTNNHFKLKVFSIYTDLVGTWSSKMERLLVTNTRIVPRQCVGSHRLDSSLHVMAAP